ncbi:unnamed protein product [Victoria cruziana]
MAALRRSLLRLQKTLNFSVGSAESSLSSSGRLPVSLRRVAFSTETGQTDRDISPEEQRRRLHNRLLYRSKQRGFLELDLVLGKWVEENIKSMDDLQIKALVDVLDLENPDLWKWLTDQEQPPEAMKTNPVFTAVQSKVLNNLNAHSSPNTRATPGQPWVRGWDDNRGREGPHYGNQ